MKAVIFGAGGQLGRALLAGAPPGWVAYGFGRDEIDIGAAGAAVDAIARTRPDIVVNAAAMTAVDTVESDEAAAQAINGAAPGTIAAACRDHGARLVQLSTDYVFDGAGHRPWRPDDEPRPLSAYGRSKLAGERAARAAQPDALIVRTAWLYAAGGANFVATMLKLMAAREEIGVVADQIGTPTHAASLARAVWALAEAGAQGIHHFTDAGAASWYDFAVAIEEEARATGLIDGCAVSPIATADYPTPAARPPFSLLDCRATWAITGVPRHWRAELRAMLAARGTTR